MLAALAPAAGAAPASAAGTIGASGVGDPFYPLGGNGGIDVEDYGLDLAYDPAMWFGDAVTLRVWPDIWLHEGFATWSEWIWFERQGGKTAAQRFKQLANTPAQQSWFWKPPPGDPGTAADLLDGTIYDRGAMTLQALRQRIGDATFLEVLRGWYAEHKYGNASTAEFVALAERESGQDLGAFFDAWLYTPGKPAGLPDGTATAEATRTRR